MTAPHDFPEHVSALQVQDSAILREIEGLRRDMGGRFDSVDKRIDKVEEKFEKVVTRDLFDSTVQRLELQDKNIEVHMEVGFSSIRGDMNKGFTEVKEGGKARTTRSRWLMGSALTVMGLISAVTFGILSTILN